MRARVLAPLALMVLCCVALFGAEPKPSPHSGTGVAMTPPMGWNSWDAYGTTVREDEVKANADYMAKHLAKYGWNYVVVDIQWYTPNPKAHGYVKDADVMLDQHGRLQPAVNRFPSAANGAGFKALADYVHSKGLKFGIHILRGIPRRAVQQNLPILGTKYRAADIADQSKGCSWNSDIWGVDMSKPGAQEYYDSVAAQWAAWGVDYVKADCMSAPYYAEEIAGMSTAMRKSGRAMVLSLSPGPTPLEQIESLRKYANLWRIENDFWDEWKPLRWNFDLAAKWAPYIQPGAWPDADMLPLGRIGIRAEVGNDRQTRFTKDEQITLMTLWSIFRSPLMFGGDLPSNDEFTLSLMTNAEVLAVNQNSTGNRECLRRGDLIAWTADVPGGKEKYIAVFNVGDTEQDVDLTWSDLGIKAAKVKLRDLWLHKEMGAHVRLQTRLRSHAAVLFKVKM